MDIKEKILNANPLMTKKQAVLSKYIIDNICEVALMNSTQLAYKVGVSESTITRFVYLLGYKNFTEFQIDLRRESQKAQYVTPAFIHVDGSDALEPAYKTVYDLETSIMAETFAQIDNNVFDAFVDAMADSDKLLLCGHPAHKFLARYALNFLSVFRDNVIEIDGLDLPFTGHLRTLSSKSAALIFCYPRYPKETLNIARTLSEHGVQVFGMTDSALSPLAQYCKHILVTPQRYLILAESNAGVIALLHALIYGVYKKNPEKVRKNMNRYEKDVLDLDIFSVKEYNFAEKLKW